MASNIVNDIAKINFEEPIAIFKYTQIKKAHTHHIRECCASFSL